MPEADETITTRLIVEAAQAIQNAELFRTQIETVKTQLKSLAEQSKLSFKDVAEGMKQAYAQKVTAALPDIVSPGYNAALKAAKADVAGYGRIVTNALSEVKREGGETTTTFSRLGDVSKLVFGTILGVTAIGALRNLVSALSDAAQSAYEFVKATFGLEIGIRAIQRAGVDITIKDMYENIDILREKFGVFSQRELVQGSAALINLTRDFGFTKEQIFEMQDAIATLAVVNGRAMDEVQRTVALAISSGYTEGLQRLGVSINRVNIAEEAARLGYGRVYMSLTEVQRSEATYNLILEKTAKYADDAAKYQNNLAGTYDKTKAAIVDLNVELGKQALPVKVAGIQAWEQILRYINEAIKAAKQLFVILYSGFGGLAGVAAFFKADLEGAFEGITAGDKMNLFLKSVQDGINQMFTALSASMGLLGDESLLGNTAINTEADANRIKETVSKALDDIVDDVDKAANKLAQKEKALTDDLTADLAKMHLQYDQKVAEANQRYNLDVLQVNQQFALQRKELEARYRENEWKAEKQFQERMQKLREEFIFDLEDALHERDARQVLRLIRRYNLDKLQATREANLEKEERARQFRLEMQQLEAQRQQRLQNMAQEHALKLQQMAQEYQLETRLRQEQYLADLAELKAQNEQKLKDIAQALWDQLKITGTGMEDIRKALEAVLGPGGDAEKIYNYYVAISQNAAAAAISAMTQIIGALTISNAYASAFSAISIPGAASAGAPTPSGAGGTSTPRPQRRRDMGGEVYKGEVYKVHKDETFVPAVNGRILNVKQSQEALSQQASISAGRSGQGMLKILMSLSPDLVADVIDQSLGQVSDVVFELERKRK